jgi:hypothetical protein
MPPGAKSVAAPRVPDGAASSRTAAPGATSAAGSGQGGARAWAGGSAGAAGGKPAASGGGAPAASGGFAPARGGAGARAAAKGAQRSDAALKLIADKVKAWAILHPDETIGDSDCWVHGRHNECGHNTKGCPYFGTGMMSVFPGLYPPRGSNSEFVGDNRFLTGTSINAYRTTRYSPPLPKLATNDTAAAQAVASW